MGLGVVELQASELAGLGQYGLAIGEAREGGGVEVGKGMERAALDTAALDGRLQKACIEMGVVPDQHRADAALVFHCLTHNAKQVLERFVFADRLAKRMPGVDAGEVQRRLLDVGTLEGRHVVAVGLVHHQFAGPVHAHQGAGDLQYRIGGSIEAPGFHIDNHGQVPAEALLHGCHSVTAQWIASPARRGVRLPSPRGSSSGTCQSFLTRVMVSVWRGRP